MIFLIIIAEDSLYLREHAAIQFDSFEDSFDSLLEIQRSQHFEVNLKVAC